MAVSNKVPYTTLPSDEELEIENIPVPSYDEALAQDAARSLYYSNPPEANEQYGESSELTNSDENASTSLRNESFHDNDTVCSSRRSSISSIRQQPTRCQPLPGSNVNVQIPRPIVITTQPTMTVVQRRPGEGPPAVVRRNGDVPSNPEYFSEGPRPWSTGLGHCCVDCHSCCCTMFCGCCYVGSIAMKLNEDCGLGCCICAISNIRTKFRIKHNIYGSICDDVCITPCCAPCVVCQIGREMEVLGYEKKCGCC